MISFPFDSQITGAQELDVPGGGQKAVIPLLDRGYTAEDLQNIYKQLYTDGISSSITDCLKVSPGTGMQVIVSPGFCMAGGAFGCLEEAKTLEIATAHSTADRIDLVVARRDNNNAYRNIDVYVVRGTPSSNPSAPAPTRNESAYEIVLAQVFVTKGATSIAINKITDTRLNSNVCGLMTPNPGVDATGIFDQYQDALDQFLELVAGALDETLAGNLQSQINDISEDLNAIKTDDTGWIKPTLGSEFKSFTENWYPEYRKKNGMVEVHGAVSPKNTINGSFDEHVIFTLPEGFRPKMAVNLLCQGSYRDVWLFTVSDTSGEVTFSRYRVGDTYKKATNSTWLPFHVTFYAEK